MKLDLSVWVDELFECSIVSEHSCLLFFFEDLFDGLLVSMDELDVSESGIILSLLFSFSVCLEFWFEEVFELSQESTRLYSNSFNLSERKFSFDIKDLDFYQNQGHLLDTLEFLLSFDFLLKLSLKQKWLTPEFVDILLLSTFCFYNTSFRDDFSDKLENEEFQLLSLEIQELESFKAFGLIASLSLFYKLSFHLGYTFFVV